jgi:hypothetical protein
MVRLIDSPSPCPPVVDPTPGLNRVKLFIRDSRTEIADFHRNVVDPGPRRYDHPRLGAGQRRLAGVANYVQKYLLDLNLVNQ